MNDYTMADLAVPKDDVSGEGCTFKNYSQPNDVTAYYTLICSGDQMLNVSRCVADTFENSAATSYMGSMWSVGGDPDMLPQLRLRNHAWEDPVSNASYRVYAIHTVSNADDPAWNVCPTDDGYAALTVPCHRRDEFADAEMVAMTKPTGSAWVTTWLKEEFGERAKSKIEEESMFTTCELVGISPQYRAENTASRPTLAADTPATLRQTTLTSRLTTLGSSFSSLAESYESPGSCKTLKILLSSQHLASSIREDL
ncbi:TKL/DRK protein kinase [Phytophthora cinnamomi]|uniref:TKL/DRK protein kinase n=1 Tax=Phytophthora cinnamomi TaxID=4785 RepID=UPI00355A60B5|nr:TKL/DRK protein kinase [Phytophthora cinnamomi]